MPEREQGGANAVGLIDFETLPAGTGTAVVTVAADDGAVSRADSSIPVAGSGRWSWSRTLAVT
ncbi:hypothetical protein [Streptomyces sp. NPDC002520]